MKAAIFDPGKRSAAFHLRIEDVPRPQVAPGYVLLRVLACGVCRTDLHIVEGDLPVLRQPLIPGHQIVGDVIVSVRPTHAESSLGVLRPRRRG